jgi:hypothetical protein
MKRQIESINPNDASCFTAIAHKYPIKNCTAQSNECLSLLMTLKSVIETFFISHIITNRYSDKCNYKTKNKFHYFLFLISQSQYPFLYPHT